MSTEPARPMKVAVLGPGGVGGLLAAVLARHGDDVRCIASESTSAGIRERGISVRSKRFGDFTAKVDASPVLGEPVDACLVTVKATQLDAALQRVPVAAIDDGVVVPFLNGVEHVALLRARYGDAVVPAAIRVEAERISVGEIEHASPFAAVELALDNDAADSHARRVATLRAHLAAAGVDVEIRSDEQTMLWGKLGFLAPLALLTTHVSAPAGVVRTTYRDELLAVAQEVAAVATAAGARIDSDVALRYFDSVPATMRSSMQRDAAAGRSIEIEAIGGAVLRAAGRFQVPVPHTERLVADLREGVAAGQ
ncbi:MAG: ketopantoate reductase family protein [Sciscionella sp.]